MSVSVLIFMNGSEVTVMVSVSCVLEQSEPRLRASIQPQPLIPSFLQTHMFKHSSAFEDTRLLGNWMLNLWLDGVCIWSCSKWRSCCNDLLISSLSSLVCVCALWICLVVWRTERETTTASYGLMRDEERFCSLLQRQSDIYWAWKNLLPLGTQHRLTSRPLRHFFFKWPYCWFQVNYLVPDDKNTLLDQKLSHVVPCHDIKPYLCPRHFTWCTCSLHNVASVQSLLYFCHTCAWPSSSQEVL